MCDLSGATRRLKESSASPLFGETKPLLPFELLRPLAREIKPMSSLPRHQFPERIETEESTFQIQEGDSTSPLS